MQETNVTVVTRHRFVVFLSLSVSSEANHGVYTCVFLVFMVQYILYGTVFLQFGSLRVSLSVSLTRGVASLFCSVAICCTVHVYMVVVQYSLQSN